MDLVNLIYRYVNRFITLDDLLIKIKEIDLEKFEENDKLEINKLIDELNEIDKKIPNEVDEREKQRLLGADKLINFLNDSKEKITDKNEILRIEKRIEEIEKSKKEKRDGGKRYSETVNLLTNNKVYIKYCKSMSLEKLLDFITQYIHVGQPPMIDNETFNKLVELGIEKGSKEKLWRLAFNYENKGKDFTKIIDYYVKEKEYWYLGELMSAVYNDVDFKLISEKVNATNDQHFINNFNNYIKELGLKIE